MNTTVDQLELKAQQFESAYVQIKGERDEIKGDMKQLKDTIVKLLTHLGFMDKDGNVRQTVKLPQMLSVLTLLAKGDKKLKEDLAFLQDCLPLLEKYMYL